MIEGTMMNRAETQTVFSFVGSALVLNGNDVSSVEKIQLDITCCAAVSVSGENILSKPRVAESAPAPFSLGLRECLECSSY